MATRTASNRVPYSEPFWRTRAAKIMVTAVVGSFAAWGIYHLERVNARHQIELRLDHDATLGPLLVKWRGVVTKNQNVKAAPGDQLPVALYFGKVLEYAESKASFGLAPTCVVRLENPQLMAGTPHKADTKNEVKLSFKPQPPKTKPQKGQEWLIAVYRDSGGNNIVHTAYPCPHPKP